MSNKPLRHSFTSTPLYILKHETLTETSKTSITTHYISHRSNTGKIFHPFNTTHPSYPTTYTTSRTSRRKCSYQHINTASFFLQNYIHTIQKLNLQPHITSFPPCKTNTTSIQLPLSMFIYSLKNFMTFGNWIHLTPQGCSNMLYLFIYARLMIVSRLKHGVW
jgi:hypothetical protein